MCDDIATIFGCFEVNLVANGRPDQELKKRIQLSFDVALREAKQQTCRWARIWQ